MSKNTAVPLKKPINRRLFLASVLSGVGGLGAYMRFWAPENIVLTRHNHRLDIRHERAPLRLVHLADFHASHVVSLEYIVRTVKLAAAQKPDLVCLTGDFITTTHEDFGAYSAALKVLADAAPTFACMGNHDGGWWARHHGYRSWNKVAEMLAAAGITVLHNQSRVVQFGSRRLQLIGLGDLWAKECDPGKAFVQGDPTVSTIVLSHNPDSKSLLADRPWHLMLCGHTHGGQLYLPGIGTPFAPVRDHRYVAGLNPWHDRFIHTTRGVGNLHGLRFNCPPEVSVLDLS